MFTKQNGRLTIKSLPNWTYIDTLIAALTAVMGVVIHTIFPKFSIVSLLFISYVLNSESQNPDRKYDDIDRNALRIVSFLAAVISFIIVAIKIFG